MRKFFDGKEKLIMSEASYNIYIWVKRKNKLW